MIVKRIATCSCRTSYYDTPGGWNRMVNHLQANHRWVEFGEGLFQPAEESQKEPEGSNDAETSKPGLR